MDGAGGVEGFLGCSGGLPCEQEGVFVASGGVDREAEGVRGSAVAEPEQGNLLAAGQDAGGVGEASAAGDLDFVQLRPVLFRVEDQPPGDRAAGRFRDGGHVPHHAAREFLPWL